MRYLRPYVRLFPIWRHGARYGRLDGRRIADGWYPERYGEWEVSRDEAERLFQEQR
jgi:hypothetical protein